MIAALRRIWSEGRRAGFILELSVPLLLVPACKPAVNSEHAQVSERGGNRELPHAKEPLERNGLDASLRPEPDQVLCGREPAAAVYEPLAGAKVAAELAACSKTLRTRLTPLQLEYSKEAVQAFPMGFGLEDAVLKTCLSPAGELHEALRKAGLCSTIAMAMVVIRCVRPNAEQGCSLADEVRSYYASSSDAEWRSLEGDALPAGATITRHGQRIPSEFRAIEQFLSELADRSHPHDIKKTEQIDPKQLDPFLGDVIRFADVNWPRSVTATRDRIHRELMARSGETFRALAALGWVYQFAGLPTSRLRFSLDNSKVHVVLLGSNELTFEQSDGTYRLTELRQLKHSDL